MMSHTLLIKALLPALGLAALAVGCTQNTATDAPIEMSETSIVLPDDSVCQFAGRGATLSYQGKRLNYTCSENTGLIGDIVIANGTEITLEKATMSGTTITGSEPMTLMISAIELADGTRCFNAGQGATLVVEGKRLNFTCSDTEPMLGLVGDIVQEDGTFSVEMATLDGTTVKSTETKAISILSTVLP